WLEQRGGDLWGAAAARLAVLGDDLGLIALAAALQALAEDAAHLIENERVGLAEARERAGLWADVADLDDLGLRARRIRAGQGRHGDRCSSGLDHCAPVQAPNGCHGCLLQRQASPSRAFFKCCTTLLRSAASSVPAHLRTP